MSNKNSPLYEDGRRIVHVERVGNDKYTYYDDGVLKITHYKKRKKILWGRVVAAVVMLVLLIMGIVQLCRAIGDALESRKSKTFSINESSSAQTEVVSRTDSEAAAAENETGDSQGDDSSEADYSAMNLRVCLDPGHGDYDTGAVGSDGVLESEQNLELARLVKSYLEERGVAVTMTRDSDVSVSLSERCSIANQAGCDLFLSIHRLGDADDPDLSGTQIWVNNKQPEYDTTLANNIMSALQEVGISQSLGVNFGYSGMPDQNYQVNTDTIMPSCILELGYMSNEYDNMLYDTYKQEYAEAIGKALIETAVELNVVDEDGTRLLNEQFLSDGKNDVTIY